MLTVSCFMFHVSNGPICQELFGCNTQPSFQTTLTKANWPFKCKTVLSNKWVLLRKQPVFGRLRQIIAHVAVGASADACDNNMTEVIFSSHQCVTGAISGTVFTGV